LKVGGVIQQQPPQGFGWFGNHFGNQFPNQYENPAFPKLPPLFLPNFVPPVYYPNTLPFPNYNPFPTPQTQPGYGSTNVPNANVPSNVPSTNNQHPGNFGVFPGQHHNTDNSHHHTNNHQGSGHTHHQVDNVNRIDSNDQFATNAFFKPTANERHWSEREEQEWQATTKAPYFENKVPGLECSLPAAAVLGDYKNSMRVFFISKSPLHRRCDNCFESFKPSSTEHSTRKADFVL
jgi:hypothetical protein